jgi:hypothetical protein
MTTYHEWHTMSVGAHGDDVLRLQQLLAGGNRFRYNARPGGVDGTFGTRTRDAVMRYKWYVGYRKRDIRGDAGETLHGYMVAEGHPAFKRLTAVMAYRKRVRRGRDYPPLAASDHYPLATHGPLIGFPYVGTHLLYGNWESDNAIDIAIDTGTPVLAPYPGVIGPQIGPLQTGGDPRLLGLRLHLVTASNEFYLAHLSHLDVHAGQHVEQGQRLGLSGSANGVEHLHLASKHGDPAPLIGLPPIAGYRDRRYPG